MYFCLYEVLLSLWWGTFVFMKCSRYDIDEVLLSLSGVLLSFWKGTFVFMRSFFSLRDEVLLSLWGAFFVMIMCFSCYMRCFFRYDAVRFSIMTLGCFSISVNFYDQFSGECLSLETRTPPEKLAVNRYALFYFAVLLRNKWSGACQQKRLIS